jgi:hypothetical protein
MLNLVQRNCGRALGKLSSVKRKKKYSEKAGNCSRCDLLKCLFEERMCFLVVRQVFKSGFIVRYVMVLLYDRKQQRVR